MVTAHGVELWNFLSSTRRVTKMVASSPKQAKTIPPSTQARIVFGYFIMGDTT